MMLYCKLVVFIPQGEVENVRQAICLAGAGKIGSRYDNCTFQTTGIGTFRPLKGAKPHLGKVGRLARVKETRLETIVPKRYIKRVLTALKRAHPYEEPAYEVYPLLNLKVIK